MSTPTEWTRAGLETVGFSGFVPFAALPTSDVPTGAGVYVVVAPGGAPRFLDASPAGWVRGDPTVPIAKLERKWLPMTDVVYIGSAGLGTRARRGISKRLDEYRRHGAGELVKHWGGRYLWQLGNSAELLVGWHEVENEQIAEDVETGLLETFEVQFGAPPFANIRRGRRKRRSLISDAPDRMS